MSQEEYSQEEYSDEEFLYGQDDTYENQPPADPNLSYEYVEKAIRKLANNENITEQEAQEYVDMFTKKVPETGTTEKESLENLAAELIKRASNLNDKKGGKKSRKSRKTTKRSRKTTKRSRKTTKKSKKSRKRKTLKKRKKSRK